MSEKFQENFKQPTGGRVGSSPFGKGTTFMGIEPLWMLECCGALRSQATYSSEAWESFQPEMLYTQGGSRMWLPDTEVGGGVNQKSLKKIRELRELFFLSLVLSWKTHF
jgi:hypothetical protein